LKDPNVLVERLTGKDETGAEAAALELAAGGEQSMHRLEPLLKSDNVDHRWWAIRTLAAMENPDLGWFRGALHDPSAEVRAAGALALVGHPDSAAMEDLIEALNDEDGVTAALATRALVVIGESAVPGLQEAFKAATPRARIQIVRALAELRDPRAIRLLLQASEEGSAAVQYWAREGLNLLGLDMIYLTPE
jgi:HEAT repeat protein